MSAAPLGSRIREAIASPPGVQPWQDREDRARVHEVLGEALAQAAPQAEVLLTSYLNHTFVPDAILSWPGGRDRGVFLRFTSTGDPLMAADVEYAAGSCADAIFLCIEVSASQPRWDTAVAETLGAAVLSCETLERLSGDAGERLLRDGVGILRLEGHPAL